MRKGKGKDRIGIEEGREGGRIQCGLRKERGKDRIRIEEGKGEG